MLDRPSPMQEEAWCLSQCHRSREAARFTRVTPALPPRALFESRFALGCDGGCGVRLCLPADAIRLVEADAEVDAAVDAVAAGAVAVERV